MSSAQLKKPNEQPVKKRSTTDECKDDNSEDSHSRFSSGGHEAGGQNQASPNPPVDIFALNS